MANSGGEAIALDTDAQAQLAAQWEEYADAVEASGLEFTRQIDQMPAIEVLDEIDEQVDMVGLAAELQQLAVPACQYPSKGLLQILQQSRAERLPAVFSHKHYM